MNLIEKQVKKSEDKMVLPAMLSIDEEYPISYDFDLSEYINFFKKLKSSK